MLAIYNTLSKKKEIFKPITPNQIKLYVCGITVYDYCHLGHARTFIAFDFVTRFLRWRGYNVTYVRNITDIDDKIIQRANETNQSFEDVTNTFIEAMHEDFRALKILSPNDEPKASDNIDGIITMIQTLIEKGFAYVGDNGDVFYEVRHFKDYGKLSRRDLDKVRSGERVAINNAKQDPLDFVLWKLAKEGEPSWDSPWGAGRPGWHIECSAMSTRYLGENFDIHGGGVDLVFPHHENEIAQSEAANGCCFANNWMHLGFLQVDKEKMSKSLGNFFTVRDVLKEHHPEVVRYFMLAAHYRSPLNYTSSSLKQAAQSLEHFYITLRDTTPTESAKNTDYESRFVTAMEDDFNTADALAVLFDLAKEVNRSKSPELSALLRELGGVLGILDENPVAYLQRSSEVDAAVVEKLIKERNRARAEKNWAKADEVRDQLTAMHVVLEDSPEGTLWRVEKS